MNGNIGHCNKAITSIKWPMKILMDDQEDRNMKVGITEFSGYKLLVGKVLFL